MTAMYQMIRPDIAIPVHGTSRHVKAHAQLAKDCQVPNVHIPENGQVIRLSPGPIKVIGGAETGLMTIEGGDIIPLYSASMQSRRKMMWNGTVTASLVLSERAELCASPMVTQNGIVDGDKASSYLAEAILRIEDEFDNMGRSARYDDRKVEDMVAKALRGLAKMMADRRPVIQVHIMRVAALDAGE
jgi:ribonuclease J